jgi:molybdate transport system ATP-binding protein
MSLLEFRAQLPYPSGFRLDAAFDANSGATALVGPSGSGKTTILSIIAGLRKPVSGLIKLGDSVLFDDRSGINLPPESRRIGYVFQQHLLFPHLNVHENLRFGWNRRRETGRRADPDRVVRVLELENLLERKPATLSGGQRQRVALGRALLCTPDLLLLDEPLASIDEELKEQMLGYIDQALAEWRIPMLYVTHLQAEVRRICASSVQLLDGRVVASGIDGVRSDSSEGARPMAHITDAKVIKACRAGRSWRR